MRIHETEHLRGFITESEETAAVVNKVTGQVALLRRGCLHEPFQADPGRAIGGYRHSEWWSPEMEHPPLCPGA
jgi:hypothetical protein